MNKNRNYIAENFPLIPKELLESLKEYYDIRKLVKYSDSVDYLRGVQEVLDFLETKFKDQNNILEDEE